MAKIIIALYVLATSAALVVLKVSSNHGAPLQIIDGRAHFNLNWQTVLGICLYGLSFLLYTYLISKFDLGYIIPLTTALVYIIIFSASFIIFKEAFTVFKVIGIALIVVGLIFLNLKKQGS